MINIQTLLANKHTSGSALVFAAVKVSATIAKTWWPEHEAQIRTTSDALESLAILYLGVSAGDAIQGQKARDVLQAKVKTSIETHDTSILENPNPPAVSAPNP